MPMARARRLCPQAHFLAPRFDLYHRYSEKLHEIFRSFTPLVEGLGLDEAFLDIGGCGALFGSPVEIAEKLRRRVGDELGLRCSVGAGPNKLVAKLASKAAKPRPAKGGGPPLAGPGIVVVGPEEALGFLWPLSVLSLWGVGPASAERLRKLGVSTVGELAALGEEVLVANLGKASGQLLHALAWGRDDREVIPEQAPKSIGHEETYPVDITDRGELERRLVIMADSVAWRVRQHGMAARTVVVKLRYRDFTTLTRSQSFPTPQSTGPAFWGAGKALLDRLDIRDGARLLGLSASNLVASAAAPGEQLQLELGEKGRPEEPGDAGGAGGAGGAGDAGGGRGEAGSATRVSGAGGVAGAGLEAGCPAASPAGASTSWDKASKAIDAVRARFGDRAVGPAVSAGRGARRGRSLHEGAAEL